LSRLVVGYIETRLTASKASFLSSVSRPFFFKNSSRWIRIEQEAGATILINGKPVALGIPGKDGATVTRLPDIPLGRPGTPTEAASAVLFLASPLAAYVSGQLPPQFSPELTP
jgi:NAD(P)-dependent dehydrogenase (short-subunit alcohol dehydrogenase family)